MSGLPRDFWESRFQEGRTQRERGELNLAFLAWCASGTLAPCRVLVPGAGRSPEPAFLLAAGPASTWAGHGGPTRRLDEGGLEKREQATAPLQQTRHPGTV